MRPHCLIVGVGPGLGLACVRRFASGGYDVSMIARHGGRLETWSDEVEQAEGFALDIAQVEDYRRGLERIVTERGLPEVVVYNAAKASFGRYVDISPQDFENAFRVNATGLLVTAQVLCPSMADRGRGALMVTGNTGSLRGTPDFAGWSPSKAAQRILSECLARELGPQGVHVAYIVVDALIDMPFARRRREHLPDEHFAKPDDLAETVFVTAHQPRSAWSFAVELRPFGETW